MKKFSVAVLGAGRMGQLHIQSLLSLGFVHLKYIYDPALWNNREAMPNSQFNSLLVGDLDRVLNDTELDACIIATPSTLHAELIIACAKARKHVFCEKPVSFDVDCLRRIRDEVMHHGIGLQIGFNRRFDPSLEKMRADIEQGRIGRIHMIKIVNRDPWRPRIDFVKNSGGLFFDFNIHDFDTLHFITKQPIQEIYAMGDALVEPELKVYGDIDTAVISMRMACGALAVIDCSRETGYGYDQRLEVFGDLGMIAMKNQRPHEMIIQHASGSIAEPMFPSFVERYQQSYRRQLISFFTGLSSGVPLSPGIDDAINAVRVAGAAVKSLRDNTVEMLG